jgi:DNA-binding GntR family transcriptional regulator
VFELQPGSLVNVPKVTSRTRLRETTDAIRAIILDGVVPTGGRLKEFELAAALGVSRATVREAVRELVHEGLLLHEPYKGLRVATVDDQGWLDLSEVRAALEVVGAQSVASHLTPERDALLETAYQRMRLAREARDPLAYNEAHISFHALIQHLSGNPVLEQVWASIETRARAVLRVDYETAPALDGAAHHLPVLAAIRSGDRDLVEKAVSAHVVGTARERIRLRHEHEDSVGAGKGR